MPLEDDLCDIVKKARTGLGLSIQEVAQASGLAESEIRSIERGDVPRGRAQVQDLAQTLRLRPEPLQRIAMDRWEPVRRRDPSWVETIHGSIGGYGVQGYLVHNGGEALVIDTGYNAPAMIAALITRRLRLVGICLTHGHSDHAEGIEKLLAHQEVPVYLGSDDRSLLSWQPQVRLLSSPDDGVIIYVGGKRVRCLVTPGHTAGGICYQVEDPEQPLCFVGDTLFAGSIGRSNPSPLYQVHLDSVHRRLLTLPAEFRLLPGHGPATTVAEEREHNPFVTVR
ncbi:MAG: MBL fold metallo-hydrolase [Nitrospira sp. CR1.3]|nr:MBL fold metallo-hydrolase [Nitrospira sp. CR1.3]